MKYLFLNKVKCKKAWTYTLKIRLSLGISLVQFPHKEEIALIVWNYDNFLYDFIFK